MHSHAKSPFRGGLHLYLVTEPVKPYYTKNTPATSATERRLDVIKDLLKVLPRGRGFRVAADLSVSVYPASQRAARPPAAKQGRSPRSKRESRSDQGSKRAATNARTRRSAVRAAKHHAERREQAEIRLWHSSPARWRKHCPLPLLRPPPRASAAGAQQPRRAHALSL